MGNSTKKSQDTETGAPAMTAAMLAVNPLATKAWLDVMTESARFVTDRFQQDMEMQKAMLACKTPADLLQLQSEFYKKAIEQYTAEATRMFEMMSKATEDSVKEATSGHSRGYDDVPL